MCLIAVLGLLAPRVILLLCWLFNSAFVLAPFAGFGVPNPLIPLMGLVLLPTTTLGIAGRWRVSEACRVSVACWWWPWVWPLIWG